MQIYESSVFLVRLCSPSRALQIVQEISERQLANMAKCLARMMVAAVVRDVACTLTAGGFVPYTTYDGQLSVSGTIGPLTTSATSQMFSYVLHGTWLLDRTNLPPVLFPAGLCAHASSHHAICRCAPHNRRRSCVLCGTRHEPPKLVRRAHS